MQVHRLPLHGTNAYVISDGHHVLVDTGPARARALLLEALSAIGLGAEDLSLVVLTHAHATAAGNAAFLKHTFHVPIAVHQADAPILASGVDRSVRILGPVGALIRLLGDTRFEAISPDVVFGHTLSLEPFGIEGTVVHTPGHTIGSVSVVLPTGDAVIGDLLMGGSFGGRIMPSRPYRHYSAEEPERVARSLALLRRLGVLRLHPGTGDTLHMDVVSKRIIDRAGDAPSGPAPTRVRERRLRSVIPPAPLRRRSA